MYSVVTIVCVDSFNFTHTLSLSLSAKKGYVGPSMVPESWDGAWGIFVFLNTFVFFFARSLWFFKKSDEKQRSNKVHPYRYRERK